MASDLRIQGEVVVNSEQAESAFNRVGDKAQQMATEVATSAGKAGQSVDKIGDGAGASAEKFTRAESRISASIKRATNELELLGKTASQRLEFNIADKGLDQKKFEPALQKLREVEAQAQAAQRAASGSLDKMGISAAQTAAALRGVPAQFTDIVTSLQGGQAPLTVFLQQGGQLRDMFGGAGAAARALGGYVLGLVNPFTIAAAAVGAIALAYNQGSREQDAFVKSIVTTGNISGVTAGQLGQYARAISSVAGTQSKAAETLAAFVAEGVRGGAMLEKYAQTAIEWEKATGQSVAKTAEQFASLQKDPLSSVLKLNEGTNFLTESVYKQIKALDEQGRSADASKVAMDALNTAMESRSKTIEQNLGYIEAAWRGITSAAKKAWDAMLNVGRAETGASQLASLRETLDQRMQRGPINDMPGTRAAWEKGNEGLRKQIDLLAEQERMLRRGAEAESERNKQLAARIEFDKAGEQYLSKRARMEREIAKATNEAAAAGVGAAELEQRIASIREKFAEKNTEGMKAQRAAAKLLADDLSALAKMAGLSPDFYKEWEKLGDMFKRGKLDVDGLTQAQAKLLEKQPVIAAETKAQADAQKQVNASIDAYRSALQAVAKEEATRVDGIAKSNADLREQIATMGLTNQQIRQRTIELNRATIAEKEQQLARLQSGFTNTREQAALEEEIRLLKERNGLLSDQGVKEQYVAAQQEMAGMWQSIDSTAHDVFVNIFEDGAGTFKRLGQTLKSALLDMLYQLTVKRWIINIGASFGATGGIFAAGNAVAGQGGGATNLLGGLGNLFGGSAAGAGGFGGFMGLGSFGSGFGAGLGALFGEAGLMGGLSAGATAIGAGNILGGLGTLAGVAAPILGPLALLGLSGAFSRKHEQHNLQGTFGGASGFEGNWHDYYRGGLFRSSKTVDTPLEADFLKGLQDAWNAQEAAVTSYAQALGLATDSIAGFTYDVNIKLKDLDPKAGDYQQQLMARVADAIKAGSNEMAQQLIGSWDTVQETVTRHVQQFGDDGFSTVEETITRQTYVASEFAREGESAIDTLTRLGSSLQAVNSVFDTLGYTLLSASLASGDMASSIIDAFGGQERFGAQTGSYFQNYYSAAERRATLQRQLTDEMDRLGFVLPATRDGFRRLVEAQRLTTTEGQQTYAALIGLSGAFAEITQSSEEAAQALSDDTDRAFAALSRYIDQQRELWQTALQAAQTLVAEARDIRDTASGAARELWGQSDDTRAMLAVQGRATIDRMLSGLRATGALPDADELSRAIKDARGGLDMSQYATVAEYELAQALLAGQLSEIGDLAGEQMTVAEKQVAAAEAQIKQLDQTLDFWREQIDLMRDTFDVITNLDAGIAVLADAVRAEQAAKEEAAKEEARRAASTHTSPGGGGWGDWGGGGGQDLRSITRTINWDTGEYVYPDGSGGTLTAEELEYFRRIMYGEISPTRVIDDLYQVPRHADGGRYAGGLALVGERGPELINFASPGHIYTADQTRDMMRGGDNAELIAELRELRARLDKIERNTAVLPQTHDVIDRVTAGGNAMLTEAA